MQQQRLVLLMVLVLLVILIAWWSTRDPSEPAIETFGVVLEFVRRRLSDRSNALMTIVLVVGSAFGIWWFLRKPKPSAQEPFLNQPRMLTRTFRAPMTEWRTIFKLTRVQAPSLQNVVTNQLVIRNPKIQGSWNLYRFKLSGNSNMLTIGQVQTSSGKFQAYEHGDELQAIQKRLPVFVRVHRPHASNTVELQISTEPDIPKAVYECVLQSRDDTIRFQALQLR